MATMLSSFLHPIQRLAGRRGLGLIALGGLIIGLTVAGLEYWGGLKPCALCWTQRGILALLTFVAFIGWLTWPTGRWTRRTLIAALVIPCLLGITSALRHLYVMANPEAATCGASIDYMIGLFPWQDVMRALLMGQSSCADVSDVMGLPIPVWSLIAFSGFLVASLLCLRRPSPAL